MSSADDIIERRRLRRKVTFWRIAAFLVLAGFILALAGVAGVFEAFGKKAGDHIARVEIDGVIGNDEEMVELLEDLGEKDQVKAVVLKISSPGGTTVGGEALFEAVRDLAGKKPVATSIGTLATSAGYMVASASDHIVARRSSIVGSIGVLFQYGNASELLDKIGVEVDAVKSSPLKAEPSPFNPTSEEAKEMLARVVDDSYDWFLGLVTERRGFTPAKARSLADGSIFTGAQGLENGLIDEIGDEDTAKKWLVDEKGIDEDLDFVDWKPDREDERFDAASALAQTIARMAGADLPAAATEELRGFIRRHLFLDGLVSVLHIE